MRISLSDVQRNISEIANRQAYTPDIIYELLAAYGRSKSAITQLREGHLNKAEIEGAVLQKDIVYFRTFTRGTQLETQVQELFEDPLTERYNPRYLIATDLTDLAAKDTLKGTTLAIKLADIDNELDFFYAWTGDEVVDTKTEAVADRRAADKMNELYIEIEKENREQFASNPSFRHELNIFFTRLLFCLFAEDTGIYHDKQFTDAIKRFTQLDGSDLSWFFGELFKSLDTSDKDQEGIKSPFREFPYVNGSIFNTSKHAIAIPKFSAQARHLILECGRQNWGEINPDIFGTMFQGVVDPTHRDENGMDYTSVPNIMKVIRPLFLDGLHEQFDKHYDDEKKLWALLNRISAIKVFDPACGSGNFLIITYKELRQLQHAIIGRIDELKPGGLGAKLPSSNLLEVDHLYGIEIDDFARELAILSIFLAKHQMNMEFNKQFGTSLAIIPLIDLNTIVHGNAARLDWQAVCPNVGHTITVAEQSTLFELEGDQAELKLGETIYDEIYLIGNPPYKGTRNQTTEQKNDKAKALESISGQKILDYIAIWFYKGAQYIRNTNAKLAFVSTNSIVQGDQVHSFWPHLLNKVEIGFAWTSFKWQNSARDQAGVTVVVISLQNKTNKQKTLYTDGIANRVDHINSYLVAMSDVTILPLNKSISGLPKMTYGNHTGGSKDLFLTPDERTEIISEYPNADKYIRPTMGSAEFIRGIERYCLWITNTDYEDAIKIPPIAEIVERIRKDRAESADTQKQKLAARAHQFRDTATAIKSEIIVPIVSSDRREYMVCGVLDPNVIIPNSAQAIYDSDLYVFALLESKMHLAWIRTVCGQLETRIRYSSTLGYNTFPINPLTQVEKDALSKSARHILLARAAHPDKTLAIMYDPDKMPADLRSAHDENDHIVDKLYKKGGFTSDEDRLSVLFDLYKQMTTKGETK